MTTEIDLRETPKSEHRERLFDALSAADAGDEFEVVADRDVDTDLLRYQIERDRELTWDHADPDAEPREHRVVAGEALEDALPSIDVRDLKPQRRHEALLDAFDQLAPDEGFVLINDHDPKPLYHELGSMHGDVIHWEYRSRGDDGWRVEVGKTGESEADDRDVVTRFDVRDIPKQERHPTIHHRYGMLPEAGTMELIAPHEPRPLQREFRQRYGDAFEWEVLEREQGRCRVHVTKLAEGESSSADADGAASTADETDGSPDDGAVEVTEELDVRDLPPAQRHEQIFAAYADLDLGEGFVLVNDHDPKPLYHQFEAEADDAFRWEYRQKEPGEFRVLIGKAEGATADAPVGSTGGHSCGEHDAPF
ncbi:DUF2249 domain-containing protein [Halomicrobium salinisoli]|uniref:DUF2249 domain-containing protein n=1 Tax=Halomicrobium salinisoli TaxID=2878391 RepID=UPI001CF0C46B|nr:DUF2249 domain-containing protein [Halomicrobium salinisoli]